MPWTHLLPPDTRAVGTGDPANDEDADVDALVAMGSGFNVLNPLLSGGADPTGATDSWAAFNAAQAAVPSTGGSITIPPGVYKLSATVPNTVTPTFWRFDPWAVKILFTGSGPCFSMQNAGGSGTGLWGGGILGFPLIDGTSAAAGACGLQIGDGEQYRLEAAAQNFTGAGSMGFHLNNQVWWTEKLQGTLWARNCTQHVVMDVSGAATSTNSFGYLDLTCYIYSQANQDGLVLQNGAYPYHGHLAVKGNFAGSASAVTNAVLRLTGTVPAGHTGAGTGSQIVRCHLDVQAECGSFANQPTTIIFGTPVTNAILGCYGILDFTQGAGTFTPGTVVATSAGVMSFEGYIAGDFNMNPSGANPQPVTIGTKLLSKGFMSGSNGNCFSQWADFFSTTLSASITVNLAPSGQPCLAAPQRKTLVLTQAASGGPFTVTWPKPGSPTTAAPAIYWAGGTAPTMSAGAGVTDVYDLETFDGIHWYAQARQNVS